MLPSIKVLSLLEAYEARQQKAQSAWKKSQWNLTKAKRRKGDALRASNVREELRARHVLVTPEPDLLEEERDTNKTEAWPHFQLVDTVEQHEKNGKETTPVVVPPEKQPDNGLRNRKTKDSEAKPEWTVMTEDSQLVDEETKLRSLDPVELFGLPNPELRQAQQEAREAMTLFVEAANLLMVLQQEMTLKTDK